jgi:hypothetical protein
MLAPTISICFENCSKISVTDTTGLYEETSNPNGWGFPNLDTSEVAEATLEILTPGAQFPVIIDITSEINAQVLPGSYIQDYIFDITEITYQNLGIASLIDGIYEVKYIIDGIEYVMKGLNVCNTECCVNKMLEKALDKYLCGNSCSQGEIAEALRARALLLQASQWAFSCGKFEEADNLLKQAAKICKTNGCGCGCS